MFLNHGVGWCYDDLILIKNRLMRARQFDREDDAALAARTKVVASNVEGGRSLPVRYEQALAEFYDSELFLNFVGVGERETERDILLRRALAMTIIYDFTNHEF